MTPRLRTASRRIMRETNEAVVLGLLRELGPISRVEIARISRLSPATVTGITTQLIADGLVTESSTGVSTGGRKPILLSFNAGAGWALGVKLLERQMVSVATDLSGAELLRTTLKLPVRPTPEQVVGMLTDEVERLRHYFPSKPFKGLGVGIAGTVDRATGDCKVSPFLQWHDVPLRKLLESALGVPALVDNDVDAMTHAMRTEAIPGGITSYLVVTLGRGIGLGMVIGGEPFRGAGGQGGELGHIIVDPEGPECACGKRGCLESLVAMPAILQRATQTLGHDLSDDELQHLITIRDERLAPLTEHAATVLGGALAMLVNVLNPGKIVVSGEAAWFARLILPELARAMRRRVFNGLADGMQLEVMETDDAFWARGAAMLLLDRVFGPNHDARLAEEG